MVSQCGFDVLSLLINDIEHLFTCLLAVYIAYLEKCPLKSLCQFSDEVVFLLAIELLILKRK